MLTSKQKSFLRSMANPLPAYVQVGKDGITPNVIASLNQSLLAHELVKVSILKSCPDPVQQVALDLASATKSEVVQLIGKTLVFYKKSKENKISLP